MLRRSGLGLIAHVSGFGTEAGDSLHRQRVHNVVGLPSDSSIGRGLSLGFDLVEIEHSINELGMAPDQRRDTDREPRVRIDLLRQHTAMC